MTERVEFITPPGRIVGGSLSRKRDKNYDGDPIPPESQQYSVQIAIPKTDPGVDGLLKVIRQAAAASWANTPSIVDRKDFSWKIKDGDSTEVDKKNKRPCDREGYPGHWVFSFSTLFSFEVANQQATALIPAESVLAGHWVRIKGDAVGNGKPNNPGVFLSLRAVQLVRKDAEIKLGGATSALDVFAAPAPAPDVVDKAVGDVGSLLKAGWTLEQLQKAGLV